MLEITPSGIREVFEKKHGRGFFVRLDHYGNLTYQCYIDISLFDYAHDGGIDFENSTIGLQVMAFLSSRPMHCWFDAQMLEMPSDNVHLLAFVLDTT